MNKQVKKCFALFLTFFVIAFGSLAVFNTYAIGSDDDPNYGLYKLSADIAIYMDAVLSPDKGVIEGDVDLSQIQDMSTGGSILGYSDKTKDNAGLVRGFIASAHSGSSQGYSYTVFKKSSGVKAYIQYGYFLKTLGIDGTGGELGQGFLRALAGYTLQLAYMAAASVPYLFSFVIEALKKLNPFVFFGAVQDFSNQGIKHPGTAYLPILEVLTSYYRFAYELSSKYTVFLWIAILAAGFFLTRNFNHVEGLKRFAFRILFIFGGIPFIAGAYTGMLDTLATDFSSNNLNATRVIASTLVDFGGWAENTSLNFPVNEVGGTIGYTLDGNNMTITPYGSTWANLRNIAYQINVKAYPNGDLDPNYRSALDSSETIVDTTADVEKDLKGRGSSPSNVAMSLLNRYISRDFYTASAYETSYKGKLVNGKNANALDDLTKKFKQPNTLDFKSDVLNNEVICKGDMKITSGGVLQANSGSQGLSPLATYNYLSTKFEGMLVTVYSNEQAASAAVKQSHYSVNLIGTGVIALLIWLNSVVMLFTYAILGWLYALALIGRNFKNGMQATLAILPAMLGSIKNIAKFITLILIMLAEILFTMILYNIVAELLLVVPNMFEDLMFKVLLKPFDISSGGMTSGAVGILGIGISLLVSSVLLVAFTIWALGIRKNFIKGVEDWINEAVSKFVGTDRTPGVGSDRKDGPGLGSAVAAGAGMAVASKFADRPKNTKNKNDKVDGVKVANSSSDGSSPDPDDGESPFVTGSTTNETNVFNEDKVSDEEVNELNNENVTSARENSNRALDSGDFEGSPKQMNFDDFDDKQEPKRMNFDDDSQNVNKSTNDTTQNNGTTDSNSTTTGNTTSGKTETLNTDKKSTDNYAFKFNKNTQDTNTGSTQQGTESQREPQTATSSRDTTSGSQQATSSDQSGSFEDHVPRNNFQTEGPVVDGNNQQRANYIGNDNKAPATVQNSSSDSGNKQFNVEQERSEVRNLKKQIKNEPDTTKRQALQKQLHQKQESISNHMKQKKQQQKQAKKESKSPSFTKEFLKATVTVAAANSDNAAVSTLGKSAMYAQSNKRTNRNNSSTNQNDVNKQVSQPTREYYIAPDQHASISDVNQNVVQDQNDVDETQE